MKSIRVHMLFLACGLIVAVATSCEREIEMGPISKDKAEWLTHWLLPLPKELRFAGSVRVSPSAIKVHTDEGASELVRCAAAELNAILGASKEQDGFLVCIGTRSSRILKDLSEVPDLDSVNNADQAYAIAPIPGSKPGTVRGIALIGRTDTGAYYATKTFMQLLEGATALAKSKGEIDLPLVTIRDWPDLEERGEWGGSANQDVEWLAERKMNLVESHCQYGYDKEGKVFAGVDQELVDCCRRHAVRFVAIISHLDALGKSGLFEKYPETKGIKGPQKLMETLQPVCWSKPNASKALGEWMCALAKVAGVEHINVWLAEHPGTHCACPQCQGLSQYEAEAKAAVDAYRAARSVNPKLTLRILLTQGSYDTNDKVLAVVPRDVGISYYDGGRTYNSNREPMIYPLLEKYAAEGGWLGCYPQLTASWRTVCPWSGPQFIKYRMTEFVNKKLRNLCGYATPSNRFYEFNVTAAAEWSWNSTGRSEREFALAWATREKLSSPEKAAEWAVTLGPVGWDVYGAHVPYPWFFGRVPAALKNGLPPLGEEPFRYLESEKKIEDDLRACERAMALAREINAPPLLYETQTITGYMQMLKGFHQLSNAIAKKKELNEAEKGQAAAAMKLVDAGAAAVVEGLKSWQQAVAPDVSASRFADTVRVTEQTAADVAAILVKLGVPDPKFAYRTHNIGGWKTEEFGNGAEIQKKWDVTPYVMGRGRYEIQFIYEKGWSGLRILRVALAAIDPKSPGELTEAAVDEHLGRASLTSMDERYTLDLKSHDPKLKYFIIANVHGSDPKAPEEKRGCIGSVIMRELRE